MEAAQTADETLDLELDQYRGTAAMLWFIATEAALFAALLFSYFWLGRDEPRWPNHEPPGMVLASIMLVILFSSSFVLYGGERLIAAGRIAAGRALGIVTLAMGVAFVVLQAIEYSNHLRTLTPATNAYGSIFYTITSVHWAHLVLGWLMLAYALVMPMEPVDRPPHRPLRNAALYWHFVDAVWIVIVVLLYYLANLDPR